MGLSQTFSAKDAAISYLRWWSDVGVDSVVGDAPYDWLGVAKPAKTAPTPMAEAPKPQLQTLEALIDHLMAGNIPEAGPANRRLRPTGNPASGLMILADFPDASDIEASRPLSDPIFDKMLEAIGRTRETAYIAFLCPGRPLTGRIADDSLEALADLARRHIALIAPKQLWLIGTAASRAILGIDDARARGNLHHVNHDGITMDAIATAHPRMFDGSKSRKAAAWAEMQRLILREDA
jgi:uracil-DNA glycosylase